MKRKLMGLLLAGALASTALSACSSLSTAPVSITTAATTTTANTSAAAADPLATPVVVTNTAAEVLAEHSAPSSSAVVVSDSAEAVAISLNGTTISANDAGVSLAGNLATITAPGTYRLSGTLDDGQIIVASAADEPLTLILDGVSISSATSAPLYVQQAAAVTIILADGTDNTLVDGASYTYASPDQDEPNAALFSDDPLFITGNGTLTVKANFNDGITSKDSLTISGGTISVNATDDGIRGKDQLIIEGGTLQVQAGGDGLVSDNADDAALGYVSISGGVIAITAGGDGIQAASDLVATDGEVQISAGGGSNASLAADQSAKGLKAVRSITIDGGNFALNVAEDALHADASITINGGNFTLAAGDDGVHAETSLVINDGELNISQSYEGIESAALVLNGGRVTIIASDDGVNAAGGTATTMPPAQPGQRPAPGGPMGGGSFTLDIQGGTLVVDAGGDGIDVNGTITMSDGLVLINGPTEQMNGALDYDGGFSISGGTLVGVGSAGMAAAPDSSSSQNVLLLNLSAVQPAGSLVQIRDTAGQLILAFTPNKPFQSLTFSSPDLLSGGTYQVSVGGTADSIPSDGLYAAESTITGASDYTSFTINSVVTTIGERGRFR